MLDWLNKILERLINLIPSIWLVAPDEAGVRETLGKYVKDCPPGWYLFWPVIQEVEKAKVKTQIQDLRCQSVWTKDHKELIVSGAVRYCVSNARKALLEVLDYDANIQALALGVIQNKCAFSNLNDISTGAIAETVLSELKKESQGWGLRIQAIYITDVGKTRNIRLH